MIPDPEPEAELHPEPPRTPTPDISPINEVRRETVQRYDLTPEAQDRLYSVPTRYNVLPGQSPWQQREPGWPWGRDETGWGYEPDGRVITGRRYRDNGLIEVSQQYWPEDTNALQRGDPRFVASQLEPRKDRSAETMQHELAHDWWFERLSPEQRWNFANSTGNMPEAESAWQQYGDEGLRRRLRDLEAAVTPWPTNKDTETYANMAKYSGNLSNAQKWLFYPGMMNVPGYSSE